MVAQSQIAAAAAARIVMRHRPVGSTADRPAKSAPPRGGIWTSHRTHGSLAHTMAVRCCQSLAHWPGTPLTHSLTLIGILIASVVFAVTTRIQTHRPRYSASINRPQPASSYCFDVA